jgi:acetyl-CoA carboxylase biotin carboxyl carrier protein
VETDTFQKLLTLMDEGGLTEIEYETEDARIRLSRQSGASMVSSSIPTTAPASQAAPAPAAPTSSEASSPTEDEDIFVFTAPMVGTFYRAASPESDNYVEVGDSVNDESVLCILEAMKVMNEIKAECAGEVVAILVKNGEPVEFGQPLFKIRQS